MNKTDIAVISLIGVLLALVAVMYAPEEAEEPLVFSHANSQPGTIVSEISTTGTIYCGVNLPVDTVIDHNLFVQF